MKGMVFAIEEFATFDGPGIRTSVFLKGCPMRCVWCHNPEGQEYANELVRSPNGCLHCGECIKCGKRETGEEKLVDASIEACPKRLIRWCAKEYTADELCRKLLKNADILLKNGGGVTFSGGEPLGQSEFLAACLDNLDGKINRAVQTCGYCKSEVFDGIIKRCDYVLFDLKLIDETAHIKYTGVANRLILDNFVALCVSGLPHTVRMPLIPGVTDTIDNVSAVARLMSELGERHIELLPYNKMAGAKYAMVGRAYAPLFDTETKPQARIDLFNDFNITAEVL